MRSANAYCIVLRPSTSISSPRLTTVADDLAQGHHLAAIGGIDGFERELNTMRSFLLLLRE